MAIYAIVPFIVNIIIAVSVYRDAEQLRSRRVELYLFNPFMWGLIAFVFSIAGLALYWVIHRSNLRSDVPPPGAN